MSNKKQLSRLIDVILPQFGMGMAGASVVNWFKKQGDLVIEGEALLEVETAKSINEIVAPATGVLESVLVPMQQEAKIYAVLATIRIDADAAINS